MLAIVISLLAAPAHADTLDVPLGDKMGIVRVPANATVKLEAKGKAETDTASWENTDSDALSMVCGKGKAPEDAFVDQLLLSVGEQKWALAPGASVKFACAGDAPVVFTDVHGQEVASLAGPVKVTVASVKTGK